MCVWLCVCCVYIHTVYSRCGLLYILYTSVYGSGGVRKKREEEEEVLLSTQQLCTCLCVNMVVVCVHIFFFFIDFFLRLLVL